MQVRKALVLALVVLATGAFLLPLTADAAKWSTPFALGGGGIKPSVAVDSKGNQHYVWWTDAGNIQYSRCTGLGGNGCSSPVNLPTNGASYYPSIAIDPQDRPNVVFETKNTGTTKYDVYWTRKGGSSWSSPKKISNEPYSELPDLAIGPGGVIHVIYQSKQNNTGYVYYTKSNGGFEFEPAAELDAAQSDAPLAEFGELAAEGKAIEAAEGQQLSNGLYPRIAADKNDNAHAVWNSPAPNYGIKYRYQTNGNWGGIITVEGNSAEKAQTPDITVAPNGTAGIVWGTYDDSNAGFAEYNNGNEDFITNDADGGLAQSLWPKVTTDCAGIFHFAFQGSVANDSQWNIYYRSYNPANNQFSGRDTIAAIGAKEQTPAIDATNIAAIVYTNTTNGIIDAATSKLDISCGSPPTNTPTPTNTPDPNITPTPTVTPGGEIWIPNTSGAITYKKGWKKINDNKATDGNYQRCQTDGICVRGTGAKITMPDGYTQVEWYTAKSSRYGIANVWINDGVDNNNKPSDSVDLCKGNSGSKPKFVKFTYTVPPRSDGQARTFEIGGPGKHSNCTTDPSNWIVVDGFKLLP